jgi:signal peptidase II
MSSVETDSPKTRDLLLPFVLTAVIVIADQITKAVIVATVPRIEFTGHTIPVIGDFLRIIHTRNLAIAFSIGRGLPETARRILFTGLPAVVLAGLVFYYVRDRSFTRLQRWAIAGIVGGGVGNLVDRIFRPEGVVDFIDVKFYGLFGLERWPTFNVADATVVVCGILLVLAMFIQAPRDSERGNE